MDVLEAAPVGARAEIFSTDQGAQFTATAFTSRLEKSGAGISTDGRGRAPDNVFNYLREYVDGWKAQEMLGNYFYFYCHEWPHQALGYRAPAEVYRQG